MRWQNSPRSANVQDRRGQRMAVGGGIGSVIVVVLALLFGVNPADVIQQEPVDSRVASGTVSDETGEFIAHVLGDTEAVWSELFAQNGDDYPEPALVMFSGAAQSACGFAQSAMGPFYCPRDRSVYIDVTFFDELHSRFGAPGDFAQAYVIAHEVGHHVQNVLGLLGTPSRDSGPTSQSVRVELQADCFAGVWAKRAQVARNVLEPGDIEEALGAASAIGDDRLQKKTQGYVVPESFTHGSSQQRVAAFKQGFESGDPERCG